MFDCPHAGHSYTPVSIRRESSGPSRSKFNCKKISVCAYRKSHSAVFTNVTLLHCAQNWPQYQFARDTLRAIEQNKRGIVGLFSTKLNMKRSNRRSVFIERRRDNLPWSRLLIKFLCLLFLANIALGSAAGADVDQTTRIVSVGPGLPFAFADFDGDRRPDLADIQIGRSDASVTDYWIQLQLSAVGRQTIRVIGPSGGLQIAARDVNGDHALDLVLTTRLFKQPVAVLLNDGHGGFSRVDPTAFPGAFSGSESSWDCRSYEAPNTVVVPSQSRVGICWVASCLHHDGSIAGRIPVIDPWISS
jgi:hypothetical protein